MCAHLAELKRTMSGMEFGVILVRYDYEPEPSITDIPVAAVKNVFVKKGYSPKVVGRASDFKIITIGKEY